MLPPDNSGLQQLYSQQCISTETVHMRAMHALPCMCEQERDAMQEVGAALTTVEVDEDRPSEEGGDGDSAGAQASEVGVCKHRRRGAAASPQARAGRPRLHTHIVGREMGALQARPCRAMPICVTRGSLYRTPTHFTTRQAAVRCAVAWRSGVACAHRSPDPPAPAAAPWSKVVAPHQLRTA
jgi:hypothetical protein